MVIKVSLPSSKRGEALPIVAIYCMIKTVSSLLLTPEEYSEPLMHNLQYTFSRAVTNNILHRIA